jgi:predicted enzyme related to lactoylglutathione lyase
MGAELVHFEIPGDDVDVLADFYAKVLGWEIGPPFEQLGGYRVIKTSDREGALGGGMYKKMMPEQGPLNYYGVDDLEPFVRKVKDGGGQVMMEKMAVPQMGWFAVCLDPAGNPFGLWKEDPNAA